MNVMTTDDVNTYVEGGAGRLRLNRPKALHSLNLAMVQQMTRALLDWRGDPTVRIVTYCEVGRISTLAAATLRELGFARVAALDGVMKDWRAGGYPVEA